MLKIESITSLFRKTLTVFLFTNLTTNMTNDFKHCRYRKRIENMLNEMT